jgi:hypothetical protein
VLLVQANRKQVGRFALCQAAQFRQQWSNVTLHWLKYVYSGLLFGALLVKLRETWGSIFRCLLLVMMCAVSIYSVLLGHNA